MRLRASQTSPATIDAPPSVDVLAAMESPLVMSLDEARRRACPQSEAERMQFDRNTEQYLPSAGLQLVETRFVLEDLIKLITASPGCAYRTNLTTSDKRTKIEHGGARPSY